MSRYMINDENNMNDINPFVVADFSLPGGWSEPHPYIDDTVDTKVRIASEGIVAGDRTIDSVMAIKPNCPMSRPLEPIRSYDSDIVNPPHSSMVWSSSSSVPNTLSEVSNNPDFLLYIALVIVIVLFLQSK
jgi:hypothetical protein